MVNSVENIHAGIEVERVKGVVKQELEGHITKQSIISIYLEHFLSIPCNSNLRKLATVSSSFLTAIL